MNRQLSKYKIGLAVVGILTVAGLLFVVIGAGNVKADKATLKAAEKVADGIDVYVTREDEIPDSLAAANVNDVPDSVTYKKLSSERYQICATFKAEQQGSSSVTETLSKAVYNIDYDAFNDRKYEAERVYFYGSYKKGENCQTAKPYLNSGGLGSYDDCTYDYSKSYSENTAYTECINRAFQD